MTIEGRIKNCLFENYVLLSNSTYNSNTLTNLTNQKRNADSIPQRNHTT